MGDKTDLIKRFFMKLLFKRIIKEIKGVNEMKKTIEVLKGKKTYINAGIIGAIAALQALGYKVPDWLYGILGALGLAALRAGIKKDRH